MRATLKYPLILAHGIAAKDSKFFWGRIYDTFKDAGIKVYWGNTDSWSSIEINANYLKETIDRVLEEEKTEKVNIIAHSKGGIDSRYLISSLGYASKVASLVTISTPHRGSPIADYIFRIKPVRTFISKNITKSLFKIYGDKNPDAYSLAKQLTTKYMSIFNTNNPNQDSVYYCSYHSYIKNRYHYLYLSYFHSQKYIKKLEGENDGLVSIASAKWGEDFYIIGDNCKNGISHSAIVDLLKKPIDDIDMPSEYLKIVEKLSQKGF